jgi:hypothetical protein
VIHDNRELLRGIQSPRNFKIKFILHHTLGLGNMSFTCIHCKNGLEERLPEEEGIKLRRGPALGMAGAPPVARGRRERKWIWEGERGTTRPGSPTPPFYMPALLGLDIPPGGWIFLPPRIFHPGADIPAWNTQKPKLDILIKQNSFLTKI